MVRTRHSGDLDETDSPKLLSLDLDKEKFRSIVPKREPVEHGNSYPRGAYHDDDDYDIFEDKVVESRLRPRTGPRRAYNYLDADSSDDDRGRRHRRHSPHKESKSPRSVKKELVERCSRRSRQMPSRLSLYQTEDNHQLRRSQRQHTIQEPVGDQSFQESPSIRTRRQLTMQNDDDDTDNGVQKEDDESDDEKEQESDDDDDEDAKDQDSDNEDRAHQYSDMYSRVKRKRTRRSLHIYDDVQQNTNNNQRDDSDEEGEPSSIRRSKRIDKKREVPQIVKSYSLREHKPRTDLYKAPVEERRIKKPTTSIFEVTPTKKTSRQPYQSPAQRRKSRKRSAAMHSSSSSTSSSGESSDEKSFRRRKAKSMAKARSRMMPMNLSNAVPPSGVVKDRVKSGASLADVEPMNIDKNITFDSIGGLGKHIRALKEMVVFPLLYDKVFQKFNVDPPRGVLFYGPPGTGKTLVARALANECSHGDKKVAFFMRKGADCLSKWVGESERQLRLLFDQAYKYRPSIIFFDEIDGLAPVRSSRQDQIHSSIVSTLLALMDGLDSRGEIVVIGATNRIDSLDPALRRPGRFDREFLFPLPTLDARKQILKIHTSTWNPRLNERFITELAEKCVGYCGADLKSLCTEAAMLALRRRYPQIYISNEALQLDESVIQVCAKDFFNAVSNIIPTSRRSVNSPGRPLSSHIFPLLERHLNTAVAHLCDSFPPCLTQMTSLDAAATNKQAQEQTDAGMLLDDLASDEDEDAPSIFVAPSNKCSRYQAKKSLESASTSKQIDTYLNFSSFAGHQPMTFRPRIMLTGFAGQGQTSYIAPALIHKMEDLPVHVLDLPALYAVTAKTPEESCANVFHEARRKCPSIIYMPYINQWWDVLGDTLRTTLLTLIQDLNPTTPLLLLATSEQPYSCLDIQLKSLFNEMSGEVMKMSNPNADERRAFFKELLLQHSCKAPPQKKTAAKRMLEVLPKAAPVKPKELTNQEMNSLLEKEELTLMELRIFLRDVLHKLGSDKKFSIFTKPVNIENAPDYFEVIDTPMDMSTMMSRIDCHEYSSVRSFMDDIDLICSNALEYNPDRGPMDKVIRHRACALKDTAYAIIKTELDKDFEKMCVEIRESRKRRGVKSTTVPNFYRTKPVAQTGEPSSRSGPVIPSYLESTKPARSIPKPDGERFSRRVRGIQIDPVPSLEDVERKKTLLQVAKKETDDVDDTQVSSQMSNATEAEESVLSQDMNSDKESAADDMNQDSENLVQPHLSGAQTDPLHKKARRTSKCVWCRPSRKRRKMFQNNLNSARKTTPVAARNEKGDKKATSNDSPTVNQPLNVDVSENTETEMEMKSPTRKTARIVSPAASLPAGVTTRRQSLSPRGSRSNVESRKDTVVVEETPTPIQEVAAVNGEVDESVPVSVQEEESKKDEAAAVSEKISRTDVSELLGKKLETLKDAVVETEGEGKKSSVVKSLDLEFGLVDSGAGSSLDGNGDSRDSMDNRIEVTQPSASSSSTHIKDFNENNNQDGSNNSTIFEESSNKLVVPTEKLAGLLDQLVAASEGFNVECLEKIYSQLSQIIFKHRHSYNRLDMAKELEKKITEMTRRLSSLSTSR